MDGGKLYTAQFWNIERTRLIFECPIEAADIDEAKRKAEQSLRIQSSMLQRPAPICVMHVVEIE